MAENLDKQVDDLIKNQRILEQFPDDYIYHPLAEPLSVKVDDQVYVAMLMRDGGQEGAEFNQIALMNKSQIYEMIRGLPDAKPDTAGGQAKSVEFTGKQVFQNSVTGDSVSTDDYERVYYSSQNGAIADEVTAIDANGEWVNQRQMRTGQPRPYDVAVLPKSDVQDGNVNQADLDHKLDGYKLVDEIRTVHSSDSANKAVSNDFLMKQTNLAISEAEFAYLGNRTADIQVSAADVESSRAIFIEEGFQSRKNELTPRSNDPTPAAPIVIPENPYPKQARPTPEFKEKAEDTSPANTQVDEARVSYKNIISSDDHDAQKTADINREVTRVLRYLSRDKNFDSDDQFKSELNEAIDDLKANGFDAQVAVMAQYQSNVENGMDKKDARNEAKTSLDGIKEQEFAVHLEQQELRLSQEAANRITQEAEREAREALETAQANQEWINTAFTEVYKSDALKSYVDASTAVHTNNLNGVDDPNATQRVNDTKAELLQFIEDLKKEHFPDHKSSRNERDDVELGGLSKQLSVVSPALEAAFYEKMQDAGVDSAQSDNYKAAFADAVMQGVTEEGVRDILENDPDNAGRRIVDSVLPKMDGVIGDLKQGLYDNQDQYREMTRQDISEIVMSPAFQDELMGRVSEFKAQAQEQAAQNVTDIRETMTRETEVAVAAERERQNNPDYKTKYDQYVTSFKNLPAGQRDFTMGNLEKESQQGDLPMEKQALLDALKQIQIDNGEAAGMGVSQPAMGGMKP
ncbi:MAG: hypothetical protein ACRBDI_08930 [Alphaproteobacteria bacterium]